MLIRRQQARIHMLPMSILVKTLLHLIGRTDTLMVRPVVFPIKEKPLKMFL